MRSRRAAALANVTKRIAAVEDVALREDDPGHVPVECGDSVAVIDHHGAAVSIHEVGIANHAARGGDDGSTESGLNVHAAMEGAFTVEWIAARAKGAVDVSNYRPQRGRGSQLVPVTGADIAHVHADSDRRSAAPGG